MALEKNYTTCEPFINCTADLVNTAETNTSHCQPQAVQDISELMLSSTGLVCIIGVIVNTLTLTMFLYHHIFQERIRRLGQDFSMTRDPMVTLIIHLNICDLLYCLIGLPSHWVVYYFKHWPASHQSCRYIAFFRDLIAYVDFSTLAALAACIAWNNLRRNKINNRRTVLYILLAIWIFWICITVLPLNGALGQFGFDPVHGKCHLMECNDWSWSPGAIINTIGVALPFIVVIISYSSILRKYSNLQHEKGTKEIMKSSIILTLCYFIFIIPIYILELIPLDVGPHRQLIGVITYSWYWLVYMVDPFVYVLYWPRLREALGFMIKDIFSPIRRQLSRNIIKQKSELDTEIRPKTEHSLSIGTFGH